MDFCQWFRYFSDRVKCTRAAKIKLSVLLLLLFKHYGSQSPKLVFFRFLTIKDTSGMDLRIIPSFWTKVVSIERKTTKIRLCT